MPVPSRISKPGSGTVPSTGTSPSASPAIKLPLVEKRELAPLFTSRVTRPPGSTVQGASGPEHVPLPSIQSTVRMPKFEFGICDCEKAKVYSLTPPPLNVPVNSCVPVAVSLIITVPPRMSLQKKNVGGVVQRSGIGEVGTWTKLPGVVKLKAKVS